MRASCYFRVPALLRGNAFRLILIAAKPGQSGRGKGFSLPRGTWEPGKNSPVGRLKALSRRHGAGDEIGFQISLLPERVFLGHFVTKIVSFFRYSVFGDICCQEVMSFLLFKGGLRFLPTVGMTLDV